MTDSVVCTRGEIVESRHRVHAVVMDADGELHASVGDPDRVTFFRSSAKPLQAIPLVDEGVLDRFGITDEELALCCASHNSEPVHLEGARSILRKVDRTEEDLACGPHTPIQEEVAESILRRGETLTAIHNNCSGKHAGMIALAVAMGWPTDRYHESGHPLQERMLAEVSRWTGVAEEEIGQGLDGCGVVTFALPLSGMARAFSGLAARVGQESAASRVVSAMTRYPYLVAGMKRLCTTLMSQTEGRVFAKTGAEGLYCAGIPERGLGVAVKVEDGARRASDVALLHVLDEVGALTSDDAAALEKLIRPPITNTREEDSGEIRADFQLEWVT